MASSWLIRPLRLRERVGRGVAPVSSTLRTRRLVVPSPPHPNPLPRGEREPKVPSYQRVIANSTVLALKPEIKRQTIEQPKRASGRSFASVVTRKRPSLNRALGLRPATHLQDRIDELLAKNRAGGVSAEEQREWNRYQYLEHLVRLAKARALQRQARR